jgi:hypothetical protein
MKKLVLVLMTAAAFSCGDGNRSSERNDMNDADNTEQAEPDTTNTDEYGRQDSEMNEQDTTSTHDRHESDTLNNK